MIDEWNGSVDSYLASTTVCASCIFDDSLEGIFFDTDGVCNYCLLTIRLAKQYGTGTAAGLSEFTEIVGQIKKAGRKKKYDVIVGVSGGVDSSYLLVLARELGLRPIAVHYDNTFDSGSASHNIARVTKELGIDLFTHVVDAREIEALSRAFLRAGVPELDGPTDIGLAEVLYRVANKYRIRYIFEGHSFVEEGVAPMGKSYVDGGYIKDVNRKFGEGSISSFPNMTLSRFLYWTAVLRVKKIRPYWYISYEKESAKKYLTDRFGWQDYGGHHLENALTAFHHVVYTPKKFGLDQRNNTLAARVRSGKLDRTLALQEYIAGPTENAGLYDYVLRRFGLSESDFQQFLFSEKLSFRDFKTYKKAFERMAPIFGILAKRNLVPMSFYLKYCFPEAARN